MANVALPLQSATVRAAARPLTGGQDDYAPLHELIGDAPYVLIGEATHGTDEFYRERARITKELIMRASCEDEVVAQLVDMQRRAADYASRDGRAAEDEYFYAEQNARLARSAEEYYRSMFRGRVSSWNLRDRHMAGTLEALTAHAARQGRRLKVVVWAHNSHLGDARATEMGDGGELNVGQLARERHGEDAVLVGLTTHHGTVTAASDWDMPAERKRVRDALPGSYEELFHDASIPSFLLSLRDAGAVAAALREPHLERAIGVVYLPESERRSHYFDARLSEQFDAVIHVDETRALEPLERTPGWERGEPPETYPSSV